MIPTSRVLRPPRQGARGFAQLLRDKLSPGVLNAQYAVRGAIVIRALELQAQTKTPNHTLPFNKVIMCNIGNPQELGQKPLTFHRQVLSTLFNPALLDVSASGCVANYPQDVRDRARRLLDDTPTFSIGAYTHSQGLATIRNTVAQYISGRDGFPSDPNHIFLTDGASPGIKHILSCLVSGPADGVLIPCPQYPLYSATLSLLGGSPISYFLEESNGWGFDLAETERALKEARGKGITPKAMVVINPGNPTGQCLAEADIEAIVRLAEREDLVIMADEVYQENIYGDLPFVSFKRVVRQLDSKVELVSFHSTSKGIQGECGIRGGYFELCNVDPGAFEEIYKMVSINLCPNTAGQCMVDVMCRPPRQGEPSYELFKEEYDTCFASLKRRAKIIADGLNGVPGISCQEVSGAMYAFPNLTIPQKAVDTAKSKGVAPDAMYALELLENTGICCVPGSGFGQRDGTFHLRTTLLPPEDEIAQVVERMGKFHTDFTARYS